MTQTTRLLPPDAAGLAEAARLLAAGRLVAFPTETVYGLGGDATSAAAVAAIYAAKGRPARNPLIVHVADLSAARRLARFDARAERLADAFWPGPLTLVLPLRDDAGLAPAVTAGLPTVALRVPDHPVAGALLAAFGGPLAAPSANPSGKVSPTMPAHVMAGLAGRIAAVIDAAPDEVWIGFGPGCPGAALSLSPAGDLAEAAAGLFDILRRADALAGPGGRIAVAPVPDHGLGRAINDRLARAAAPRPR